VLLVKLERRGVRKPQRGLHNKAQGNALGIVVLKNFPALKRRNIEYQIQAGNSGLFRHFRAWRQRGHYSQGFTLGFIIGLEPVLPLPRRGWAFFRISFSLCSLRSFLAKSPAGSESSRGMAARDHKDRKERRKTSLSRRKKTCHFATTESELQLYFVRPNSLHLLGVY